MFHSPPESEISVLLNGQAVRVPPGTSIAELLERAEIPHRVLAVEVNGEIVPRERHPQATLQPGDVVEAVTLVGGG